MATRPTNEDTRFLYHDSERDDPLSDDMYDDDEDDEDAIGGVHGARDDTRTAVATAATTGTTHRADSDDFEWDGTGDPDADADADADHDADDDADDFSPSPNSTTPSSARHAARRRRLLRPQRNHPDTHETLRDLTSLAVWSVSSAKPGNGVDCLLDGRDETYWQSDGPAPHHVSAQFHRKVRLVAVKLLLNFPDDDSYTPQKVSIRVGSTFHDLQDAGDPSEFDRPEGWVTIPLVEDDDAEEAVEDAEGGGPRTPQGTQRFVRAHMLQVLVHSNHQNGRDTHIRQVRVLGPAQRTGPRFTTTQFQMYESIR